MSCAHSSTSSKHNNNTTTLYTVNKENYYLRSSHSQRKYVSLTHHYIWSYQHSALSLQGMYTGRSRGCLYSPPPVRMACLLDTRPHLKGGKRCGQYDTYIAQTTPENILWGYIVTSCLPTHDVPSCSSRW